LSADAPVELIPYGVDPLLALAERLLERHVADIPDLTAHAVLFPQASAVPRFHHLLLEAGARRDIHALLPPRAQSLRSWAARHAALSAATLSQSAREALFLEALADHAELRRRYGTWPLIDSLSTLFDRLTLEGRAIDDDPEVFRRMIAATYGANAAPPEALGTEAALVHTLWRAWRRQLAETALRDEPLAYVDALARSASAPPASGHLYAAGFLDVSRTELDWLQRLAAAGRLTLFVQGGIDAGSPRRPDAPVRALMQALHASPPPPHAPPRTRFVDSVFGDDEIPLLARAQAFAHAEPVSAVAGRLRLFEAADAEEEAQAISLQLRSWWLVGKTNLGVITNDRRLARRLRALLERAGIGVEDAAGWALSTTSAATALARWLACIERDFHYDALLDFLRSPFISFGLPPARRAAAVNWFERHVVLAHRVHAGLVEFRNALEREQTRLDDAAEQQPGGDAREMLRRLENAVAPARAARHAGSRRGIDSCRALRESIERLGLPAGFAVDDAGREILGVLADLEAALAAHDVVLAWPEFTRWLERTLEQRRFRPRLAGSGIELMSLAESRLYHFDALVIAAANEEHLPGGIAPPPFFNDGVRAQLGLPRAEVEIAVRFHDFRRLLEAGDEVLITRRHEERNEALAPSPWFERLRAFHVLAYGDDLEDRALHALVAYPGTDLALPGTPAAGPVPPAVAHLPRARIPERFSASSHQSLIDCAYQFYCHYGLQLLPLDDVTEEMEKSDYGQRVHRVLQAFHSPVAGLPAPWREPLTAETLPAARERLRDIAAAVFAADLKASALARGWMYRFESVLDDYLAWQAEHSRHWRTERTEAELARAHAADDVRFELAGRLDRLDRDQENRYSLIDYKTGALPRIEDVLAGEAVQLPTYALLTSQPVAEVLYLGLGQHELAAQVRVGGEVLGPLLVATRERLFQLKRRLDAGAALPARGDDASCARCPYMGICRKQLWQTASETTA
jgi:ATP-dependent helicase/nuclease subunit B